MHVSHARAMYNPYVAPRKNPRPGIAIKDTCHGTHTDATITISMGPDVWSVSFADWRSFVLHVAVPVSAPLRRGAVADARLGLA